MSEDLAQASADNRRTNCPMRRRSASQKTESSAKTPPFRAHWESRFNANGNCSSSHKVAREGCCHEYCERYDANPPGPGCIGVAIHVELPEDRVRKKAFQTLGL